MEENNKVRLDEIRRALGDIGRGLEKLIMALVPSLETSLPPASVAPMPPAPALPILPKSSQPKNDAKRPVTMALGPEVSNTNGDESQKSNTTSGNNSIAGKSPKIKDPNAPKKPLSSFLLFCQEYRASIKAQDPSLHSREINRRLGSMWEHTTDRSRWENEAHRLNEQFKKLKEEYLRSKEPVVPVIEVSKQKATEDRVQKEEIPAIKKPKIRPVAQSTKESQKSSSPAESQEDVFGTKTNDINKGNPPLPSQEESLNKPKKVKKSKSSKGQL